MFSRIASTNVLLMTVLALVFTLAGCGSPKSAILGTWERVTPAEDLFSFLSWASQIEFLEDGTFVLPQFMNLSGKYSFPQSDRIQFEISNGSITYKFTLSGDKLMFEEKGKTIEYKRLK